MPSCSGLKSNFAHLQAHDEQLLCLGMLAECYPADRIKARPVTEKDLVEDLTPVNLAGKGFTCDIMRIDHSGITLM